jgi:hypothetical protein
LFVDRVYESVITHENSINRNNKKCVRHVAELPNHHAAIRSS